MPVLDTLDKARARVREVGIYAPLGAYDRARESVSDLDRGAVRRLYRDLVRRGERRVEPIEKRASREKNQIAGRARDTADRVRKSARVTQDRGRAAGAVIAPKLPRVAAPKRASDLPIQGYSKLQADEIVAQSRGLTQTDLAKIYKWEEAHQARATVLKGIESQFVDLPIPTYDALTSEKLNDRLVGLSDDELRTLRRYEKETKARSSVLERIDSLL